MQTHVKVLGVLHIVFGALGVLVPRSGSWRSSAASRGLIGISADRRRGGVRPRSWAMVGTLIMVLILRCFRCPGSSSAGGIMNFRPWARTWGIVLSAFELIHVPFGTILGIYGLWVLLST